MDRQAMCHEPNAGTRKIGNCFDEERMEEWVRVAGADRLRDDRNVNCARDRGGQAIEQLGRRSWTRSLPLPLASPEDPRR